MTSICAADAHPESCAGCGAEIIPVPYPLASCASPTSAVVRSASTRWLNIVRLAQELARPVPVVTEDVFPEIPVAMKA